MCHSRPAGNATERGGEANANANAPTHSFPDRQYSNLFSDAVEDFVHFHACWVPIVSEAYHKDPVLFRQDGLVNLPAVMEMR